MPEGPSIILLREKAAPFISRKILDVKGEGSKFDLQKVLNCPVLDLKTFGKEFLICLPDFTIRVHLQLFGSYLINERKDGALKLGLIFGEDEELNFYACDARIIEEPLDQIYDWSAEVMHESWDAGKAVKKINAKPDRLIGDVLLDQGIFAGVGNKIKDEVLYEVRVHPESVVGEMGKKKLADTVDTCVSKSFEYLEWEKSGRPEGFLKVHRQQECPVYHTPLTSKKIGKTKRQSYFCEDCQKLYV